MNSLFLIFSHSVMLAATTDLPAGELVLLLPVPSAFIWPNPRDLCLRWLEMEVPSTTYKLCGLRLTWNCRSPMSLPITKATESWKIDYWHFRGKTTSSAWIFMIRKLILWDSPNRLAWKLGGSRNQMISHQRCGKGLETTAGLIWLMWWLMMGTRSPCQAESGFRWYKNAWYKSVL